MKFPKDIKTLVAGFHSHWVSLRPHEYGEIMVPPEIRFPFPLGISPTGYVGERGFYYMESFHSHWVSLRRQQYPFFMENYLYSFHSHWVSLRLCYPRDRNNFEGFPFPLGISPTSFCRKRLDRLFCFHSHWVSLRPSLFSTYCLYKSRVF